MRRKRAAIIFGGLLLSSLFLPLLAQIIFAQEPPGFPHQFAGQVTSGGQPVGVLELRVKAREGNRLVTVELTPGSVNTTDSTGFYGSAAPFRVPPDKVSPGDELFFFLATDDGTGEAATKTPAILDSTRFVDIVLEPRSSEFIRGIPFPVDVVVKPINGQPVDAVDVFLDFSNGKLEVVSITTGAALENVLSSSFSNTTGIIEYRATSQTPPSTQFVLATVTFNPTTPAATTDIDFHQLSPRTTTARFQGSPVLRSLAGLELSRLVPAVTEIETEVGKEIGPVFFEISGTTRVNLAIFGPPRNIDINPASPSNSPRPTFTWTPPVTGDIPGDVVGFEVRIIPDQTAFKDIGNVTIFTPGTSDFPDHGIPDGPHTFQVRAVGSGDRKDAVGSLDFVITLITPPVLVAPPDDALLNTRTPFFDWLESTTGNVDVYLLQVTSGDINGESLDIDAAIPSDTTQFQVPTVDALADGDYQWRVIARDVSLTTASSVTRSFTLDATPPSPPELVAPEDNVFITSGTPLFDWELSTGDPDVYLLQVTSGDDDVTTFFSPHAEIDAVPFDIDVVITSDITEFRPQSADALEAGAYRWRVTSRDNALNTASSVTRNFTILFANVDLRLESESAFVRVGTPFDVNIKVEPKGLPVASATAFLNFNTGDLEVVGIRGGATLEEVLISRFDNALGTVDFSATGLGEPPTGDFVLAVVTFISRNEEVTSQTTISFNQEFPRKTDVAFSGVSLLRELFDADFAILKPTVDIRLKLRVDGSDIEFTEFEGFARNEDFSVRIVVEPNGQSVSAASAHLDFDTSDLEVLNIDHGANLEELLISSSDNVDGTIDFSAATAGIPPTEDFTLAVVDFRAKRATEAVTVGFHQEDPRQPEAAFQGVPVLRELIGFPLEISLSLSLNNFTAPFDTAVVIKVRANGNEVSAADAFLDISDPAGDLEVTSITAGARLEQVLTGDFNNAAGTVDVGATTVGVPPIGEFDLAVVAVTANRIATANSAFTPARIDFHQEFPRKTQAAFDGSPFTIVEGVAIQALPPEEPENVLKIPAPKIDDTPSFQWDPPIKRPVAGIKTFTVTIEGTGENLGPSIVDDDARQVGTLVCFGPDESSTPCFNPANGVFNFDLVTIVEFTLADSEALSTGRYTLSVAAIDNLDQVGTGGSISELFIIDTEPPSIPVPRGDLAQQGAFTHDATPLLEWETSVDTFTDTGDLVYDVEVATDDQFSGNVGATRVQPGELEVIPNLPSQPNNVNLFWHVGSVDDGGEEPPVPGTGNASDFSQPIRFTIDTLPPSTPVDLELTSVSVGVNTTVDPTPSFRWQASKDPGFIAQGNLSNTGAGVAASYIVAIMRSGAGTVVTDEAPCLLLALTCGFTVSDGLDDGTYTLLVTAVDNVGNSGDAATVVFSIDTTPPSPPALMTPEADELTNSRTIEFEWGTSTSADIASYRLQVTSGDINSGPFDVDKELNHPTTANQITLPGDAIYTWRVGATDQLGNSILLADLAVRSFQVDTVPPSPPPLVFPDADDLLNTSTIDFEWTVSTSVDIFSYRLQVTSADITTGPFDVDKVISHPTTTDPVTLTQDAVYRWRVGAIDRAGNEFPSEDLEVRKFLLDTTAPDRTSQLERVKKIPTGDNITEKFTWKSSTGDQGFISLGNPANTGSGVVAYDVVITRVFDQTVVLREQILDSGDDCTPTTEPAGTRVCELVLASELAPSRYTIDITTLDRSGNSSEAETLVFLEGPGDIIQNLQLVAPVAVIDGIGTVNIRKPQFRWGPPVEIPDGGIETYEVAITGNFEGPSPFDILEPRFKSVTSAADFVLRCFDGDGDLITSGDACTQVMAPTDQIEITPVEELPEGTHQLGVRVVFRTVPMSPVVNLAFAVDTTPPAPPALVSPDPGNFINNGTIDFQWERSTSQDVASYRLQVTSGDINTISLDSDKVLADPTTSDRITLPADATYRWRVGATDTAENEAPTVDLEVRSFLLDTELPTSPQNLNLVSVSVGDNLTTDSTPSFQWERSTDQGFIAQDNPLNSGSGVKFYRVAITNDGNVVVTGNVQDTDCDPGSTNLCQFTVSGGDVLPDGAFTIAVSAVDNADNASDLTTLDLTVDTTPPVAPALLAPEDTSLLNTRTPLFDWADSPSGDIFSYRLQVTSGNFNSGPLGIDELFTGSPPITEFLATQDLADADYQWRVVAGDKATNTASSVTRAFTVDQTPPGEPVLVSPADDAFLSTNTPTFDWQLSEGVQDYLLRIVNLGDDINVGPFVITALVREPDTAAQAPRELADGAYQWIVVARDRALNDASSETRTFTVDTVFPGAPPLVAPSDGALLNTGAPFLTPLFDWEAAEGDVEDYLLQAVVSGVDIETGPFALDVVVPGDTTEFQMQAGDALADGTYQWVVISRDKALNSAPSVIRTFTGDATRPTTPSDLTEVTTGDEREEVFTWVRSVDPNFPGTGSGVAFYNIVIAGPQTFLITADDSEALCPDNLCRFTTHPLIPGNYSIEVTAVDQATNESLLATRNFRAGSEFAVQNLRVIDPAFQSTVSTPNPEFGWSPPTKLPNQGDVNKGGIKTYEVAITGNFQSGSPSVLIPFTSFTNIDFFTVTCTGRVNGTGSVCEGAIGSDDLIKLTVNTVDGLPDGTHLLAVRVVRIEQDIREDPVELAFTVDTTPPTPPALVAPEADELLNTRTIDLAWELSTSTDIASYRLQVTSGDINTGPFDTDVELQHPITEDQIDLGGDGTYSWRVGATDKAGNEVPTGDLDVRTFNVDTAAPNAPALVSPGIGDFINTRSVEFAWEPSTSADIDKYRLQVTSGDINTGSFDVDREISDPTTSDRLTLPGDATYTWRVGAKDLAGNEVPSGDLETRSFTLDTEAPGVPKLVAPEDGEFLTTGTPLFDWGDSTGDVVVYLLQVTSGDINTGPFDIDEAIARDTTEFQLQPADALADDTYEWKVVSRDNALNTGGSVTRTFVVDTTPPTAPGTPEDVTVDPENVPRAKSRILQWDRSTDPGFPNTGSGVDIYKVVITGPQNVEATVLDADCNFSPDDGRCQFTTPELTPAGYNITIIAVDKATNESLPTTSDFRAGPLFVVQNLQVVDAVFVDLGNTVEGRKVLGGAVKRGDPTFRWTRPENLPKPELPPGDGGIRTYEVAIAGDPTLAPEFDIPFNSFTNTNFFTVACFAQDGTPKGAGLDCVGAIATGDEIEVTVVTGDVPDGTHLLRVRVIPLPAFGATGDPVELPFTVDRTPPDVSKPVKESFDDDRTPQFTWTSEDVHTEFVVFHRVHIESESFIDITVPGPTVLISPAHGEFAGEVSSFTWFRARDDISTGSGLTYILEIGTSDFTNPIFRQAEITDAGAVVQLDLGPGEAPASGDFVWRVRAVDRSGNLGDFSPTSSFTIGTDDDPPGKPTLILPPNGSIGDDPTLRLVWSEVADPFFPGTGSGIRSFNMEIGFGTDLTDPACTAQGIPGTELDLGSVPDGIVLVCTADGVQLAEPSLRTGDYIWHVQAVDRAGNTGEFSDPSTFTINDTPPSAPTLVSPPDRFVLVDETPTFIWNDASDNGSVASYTLEVGRDSDFTLFGRAAFRANIEDTLVTLRDSERLTPGEYGWRVQAVDDAGNAGDFSDPFTFTVVADLTQPGVPTLISPTDESLADNPRPTLSWTRVQDPSGVSYNLEIGLGTSDFTDLAFTADAIQATQFTLPQDLAIGNYIWHVQAVDGEDNTGDFSAAFTFTIVEDTTPPGTADLITPLDGSTGSNTTPTFTWTQVTDSTGVTYTLEIGTGDQPPTGDFTDPAFRLAGITGDGSVIQHTISGDLGTGDFVWHVLAVKGAGTAGAFSARFSFTVDAAAPTPDLDPELLSPATGDASADPTPTFVWSQVNGDLSPVTYTLEIGTGVQPVTGGFNDPVFTGDVPDVAILSGDEPVIRFVLPQPDALQAGDFVWRVLVVDEAGNTGDSDISRFTIVPDNTPPGTPTLLTPKTGDESDDSTITFTWSQVTGDDSVVTYTLEIATGVQPVTGSFNDPVFTGDVPDVAILSGDKPVIRFTILEDTLEIGNFVWHVRAEDGAGNPGDFSAQLTFTITPDRTPPEAPTLRSPATGAVLEVAPPAFAWNQVVNNTSGAKDKTGVGSYILEIATGDQPVTGDFTDPIFTGDVPDVAILSGDDLVVQFSLPGVTLGIGDHVWHLRAVDRAGNRGDFSDRFEFTIIGDQTPPSTPVLQLPASGDITATARTTFVWSESTDAISDVTYNLQVSQSRTGDFSSPVINVAGLSETSFRPQAQLPGGVLSWRVVAADESGNTADSGFNIFTVVGTPEDLTMIPFPSETGTVDYTPTFKWRPVTVNNEEVSYEVSLDSGPFKAIGAGTDSGDDVITSAGPISFGQHHIFQVRAVVTDSNLRGGTASLFFSDNVTTGGAAVPGTLDSSFTVALDDFLPLGEDTIRVSALDRLGNASDPAQDDAERRFRVSQSAIFLVPERPDPVTGPASVALTVRLDPRLLEVDGAEIAISLEAPLQFGGLISSGAGVTITDFSSGPSTSDFKASFDTTTTEITLAVIQINAPRVTSRIERDVLFANISDRKTVGRFETRDIPAVLRGATVTINRQPTPSVIIITPEAPKNERPVADAGDGETVEEGEAVSLSGSAEDDGLPEGAVLSFSWIQTSGPAVTLSGADTATPSFIAPDDGVYTFKLVVSDTELASDPDVVSVTANNLDPEITNVVIDPDTVNAGETSVITVNATDVPADIPDLLYSFDCDGDGQFEVRPQPGSSTTCTFPVGPGDVTVGVQVEDQDGGLARDSETVTIEVNEPPTADAGDDKEADEGQLVAFSGINSVDEDGEIVSYAWDFGDETTGDGPSVTHLFADDDVYTVTLIVTDNEGSTGDTTVEVDVANVPPTLDPGDDQFIDEGEILTIAATATDVEADTPELLYSFDCNGDGDFEVEEQSESFTDCSFPNGPRTVTVGIEVDDQDDEGITTANLTVTVRNVAPGVDDLPGISVFAGDEVGFAFSFDDPGTSDTHTASFNWGDGSQPEQGDITEPDSPGAAAGTHTFVDPGPYTVVVTVTDSDGAPGTGSQQVVALSRVAQPEQIEVTEFSLSTKAPIPPAGVELRFRLRNISQDAVTVTDATVHLNGEAVFTFPAFDLAAQTETGELRHTVQPTEADTYALQLYDRFDSFIITPPTLRIDSLVAGPKTVGPGGTEEIVVGLTNVGSLAGTFGVSVQIDDTVARQSIFLGPGASGTVGVKLGIPDPIPDSGITSAGVHTIRAGQGGRLRATYEVPEPSLATDLDTEIQVSPETTEVLDANNERIELAEGFVELLRGSIVLSIPVRAAPGVRVGSFVDTSSGITVIGKEVRVPVKDPATGEVILRLEGTLEQELEGTDAGDRARASFESFRLITEERRRDLSADDPTVGDFGVALLAALEQLPQNVRLEMTINKELTPESRTSVELKARERGKLVASEAGTVTIRTENLDNERDIGLVTITMKVSAEWIDRVGLRNVRVAHVDELGIAETIIPTCSGPDENNEYTCEGVTRSGLSEFSLLALVDVPPEFSARNLVVAPDVMEPGNTANVSVNIVNEGEKAGDFSTILTIKGPGADEFEAVEVKEVSLEGGGESTILFFVLREEQGVYDVRIEGRRGEFLTGSFSVFRKIDPANLSFSSLLITPTDVRPGQPVNISLFVANIGDQDGSTQVEFRINDVLTVLRSLSIPAGGRVEALFQFIPPAEGTFFAKLVDPEGTVAPLTGRFTATSVIPPALFRFSNLDVTPLEVFPGDDLTATLELTNVGEQLGVITINLLVNDVVFARQDLSLDELSAVPITFTVAAPDGPGVYTLRIEGIVRIGNTAIGALEDAFTVLEITPVPLPTVQRLSVTPERVQLGETVTVTVDVINEADVEASRTLTLRLQGELVEERTVTIAAGQTKTETFTFAAPAVGTLIVELNDIPREIEVVPIRIIAPAALDLVSPLTIEPKTVKPQDLVTITALVANAGDEAGLTDVILKVRGQVVKTLTVEIPGQQQVKVSFEVSREEEGDYEVEVEVVEARDVPVLEGSFTVAVEPVVKPIVAPAALDLVSPLTIEPKTVKPQDLVTITALVANAGDEAGLTNVILRVRGQKVETVTVEVPGQQQVKVSFEVSREEAGDYEVEVEVVEARDVPVLEGSFIVEVEPVEQPIEAAPPVANLILVRQTLKVTPDKLNSGEPVTVSVDVSNEGTTAGSETFALIVDGKEIEEKTVTLDPSEITTVSFTLVERGAGTHTVAIGGVSAEFTVTRPAPLALTIALLVLFALLVGGLARMLYFGATRRRLTPEPSNEQ